MSNFNYQPFNMDDELTFGKYEGLTIEEVLEKDPTYLRWATDNDVIELGNDAFKEFETAIEEWEEEQDAS